jgi:hypothetical protein
MSPADPSRRRFLAAGASSFSSLVLAAHAPLLARASRLVSDPKRPAPASARIARIDLETAVPLAEMAAFYGEKLSLPVLESSAERLVVLAGASRVAFTPSRREGARPFYHFAFNIPENKIRLAADWQRARSPLIPIPPKNRDPEMPDDVVDYRHWNAHSVFFFDPAENVVEYIARHDLKNSAPGPFGPSDVLCASEIAFVVDDVPAMAEKVRRAFALENYRGASDGFAAIGDENGLLLVMQRGRHISFASPQEKRVGVEPVKARIRATAASPFSPPEGFPYEITAER